MVQWRQIESFEDYSVSTEGEVRSDKHDRILSLNANQYGVVHVGLMRDGKQYHRSVPLLVAKAFLVAPSPAFDTPINMDGDRLNNRLENLTWRPRWFAVKFNQQFLVPYDQSINMPILDMKTGEICDSTLECCRRWGLLEKDVVFSILNRSYVWPTYQEFKIIED